MDDQRQKLQAAFQLHQQGRLVEAAAAYVQILKSNPGDSDALHFFGILKADSGQFAEARQLLERSLAIKPVKSAYVENYVSVQFKIGDYECVVSESRKAIQEYGRTETLQYVLAISLFKLGRLKEADDEFLSLLRAYPRNLAGHNERASTLAELGRYEEALSCVDGALKINSAYAEAFLNKGNILVRLKRHDESIAAYEKALAIKGNLPEALLGSAMAYRGLKQFEKANSAYNKALALKPDLAAAWLGRGSVFIELGRHEEGLAAFDKALALAPGLVEAWLHRGNVLTDLRRAGDALSAYEKALALRPDLVEAWLGRGDALSGLKRYNEALAAYEKALALKPGMAEGWLGRGNVFVHLKQFDDALAAFDRALTLAPDCAPAMIGRGIVFNELKRYEDACVAFDRAIAMDPNGADAYWHKALVKLSTGSFAEGWDLYEWRSRVTENIPFYPFIESLRLSVRQDRAALEGKSVAVISEQGVGDEIMFASMLPDLVQDAKSVHYEVDPRLVPVVQRAFPDVNVVGRGGSALGDKEFDVRLQSGSLGYAYRRDKKSFPGTPYLSADPDQIGKWNTRLSEAGVRKKVGISWRGGGNNTRRNERSMELEQLSPLIRRDDCYFVSLQYGNVADEIASFNRATPDHPVHSPFKDFNDFDDFAALIMALDLVISVQNTTVHMCGAIGKTCWGLVPYRPEWRYGNDPHHMIWYSSIELFRQVTLGDWAGVVSAIEARLAEFTKSNKSE